MTITCSCGVQSPRAAVDEAMEADHTLYCKACRKELPIPENSIVMAQIARDVHTIRRVVVAAASIVVVLFAIGCLIALIGWLTK